MKYEVKQKIDIAVTFKGTAGYSKPSYTGWGYDDITINKFEDEEGNILVWKTTSGEIGMKVKKMTKHGEDYDILSPNKGAKIQIKGTVKAIGEYKGETQIELTRCKLVEIIEQAKSAEEVMEEKKEEQFQSIDFKGGDTVLEMTYKNYKERYADCETVIGSFRQGTGITDPPTIAVIVRAGRLKNSGVRGEHFNSYRFTNEEGKNVYYRAVNEGNATKRVNKENPDHTWTCTEVIPWEPRYKEMYW